MAGAPTTTALARRFAVDVDTAWPSGPPVWARLYGMTDFKPMVKPTNKATSDYETEGNAGNQKVMQETSVEVTYLRKLDAAGAPMDAHEAIRKAVPLFDDDGTVHLRWYDRTGAPEAYEFYGIPAAEPAATGVEDLDGLKVSFADVGRGAIPITNPIA